DLLVEHEPHLLPDPVHNVEVRDVDDVIAVELLLLVDRSRSGLSTRDLEELLLLHVTLDVALGSGLLVGKVSGAGLETGERKVTCAVQNRGHPLHPASDPLGSVVDLSRIREERLDVRDAVLLGVSENGLLPRTTLLRVSGDVKQLRVSERGSALVIVLHSVAVLLEQVPRHVVVLLVGNAVAVVRVLSRAVVLARRLESLADEIMEHVLLLLVQRVINLLNGLLVRVLSSHVISFVVVIVGVLEVEPVDACIHDSCIVKVFDRAIGMLEVDIVDESSGIGSGDDKTNLSNKAVHDLLTLLHQLVSVDGKRIHVAMLHGHLGTLSLGRTVEVASGVNAVRTVLKNSLTKNIVRIIVPMLPH